MMTNWELADALKAFAREKDVAEYYLRMSNEIELLEEAAKRLRDMPECTS